MKEKALLGVAIMILVMSCWISVSYLLDLDISWEDGKGVKNEVQSLKNELWGKELEMIRNICQIESESAIHIAYQYLGEKIVPISRKNIDDKYTIIGFTDKGQIEVSFSSDVLRHEDSKALLKHWKKMRHYYFPMHKKSAPNKILNDSLFLVFLMVLPRSTAWDQYLTRMQWDEYKKMFVPPTNDEKKVRKNNYQEFLCKRKVIGNYTRGAEDNSTMFILDNADARNFVKQFSFLSFQLQRDIIALDVNSWNREKIRETMYALAMKYKILLCPEETMVKHLDAYYQTHDKLLSLEKKLQQKKKELSWIVTHMRIRKERIALLHPFALAHILFGWLLACILFLIILSFPVFRDLHRRQHRLKAEVFEITGDMFRPFVDGKIRYLIVSCMTLFVPVWIAVIVFWKLQRKHSRKILERVSQKAQKELDRENRRKEHERQDKLREKQRELDILKARAQGCHFEWPYEGMEVEDISETELKQYELSLRTVEDEFLFEEEERKRKLQEQNAIFNARSMAEYFLRSLENFSPSIQEKYREKAKKIVSNAVNLNFADSEKLKRKLNDLQSAREKDKLVEELAMIHEQMSSLDKKRKGQAQKLYDKVLSLLQNSDGLEVIRKEMQKLQNFFE